MSDEEQEPVGYQETITYHHSETDLNGVEHEYFESDQNPGVYFGKRKPPDDEA